MDKKDIEIKTEAVFKKHLPKIGTLRENSGPSSIRSWDSLTHVMIISDIEQVFGIRFSLEEMLFMTSYGSIIEAIQRKIE